MRVVLKPAGVAVLLSAIGGLAALAFYGLSARGGPAGAVAAAPGAPPPAAAAANVLRNGSFEQDDAAVAEPSSWAVFVPAGHQGRGLLVRDAGAAEGRWFQQHSGPDRYQAYTFQTARDLPDGEYVLRAKVRARGGKSIMGAKYTGLPQSVGVDILPAGGDGWREVRTAPFRVTAGKCEVGFWTDARAPGVTLDIDDVSLTRAR